MDDGASYKQTLCLTLAYQPSPVNPHLVLCIYIHSSMDDGASYKQTLGLTLTCQPSPCALHVHTLIDG